VQTHHRKHLDSFQGGKNIQDGVAALPEGTRDVECHINWYPKHFHLRDMVAKSTPLIRLDAANCQGDDELLNGGQRPGERLAQQLQQTKPWPSNDYFERLVISGLGSRSRAKPELIIPKTQVNRSKLTFCITDKLAEMRNREEATGMAAEFSVEMLQGWGSQPNHERLQVKYMTRKDEMRKLR